MKWWNTRNVKRQQIVFFVIYAVVALLANIILYDRLIELLAPLQLAFCLGLMSIILAVAAGFLVARRLQRRIDKLQLGLIRLQRGSFSSRLQLNGPDPFDILYEHFNEMAAALEKRMQVLQKLGEEESIAAEAEERAVLEERRRLARDLHDTVSQQLFAMHMHASSLPVLLERNPEHAQSIVEQLIQMSQLAQKQIRGLIAQLRPLELEGRSLSEAIEAWFPDYCRHNDLKGTLHVHMSESLSDGIEHQMFMMIQEAMANVVKHASAKQVSLTLQESDGSYVVQVTDDGIGFNEKTNYTHSYGLSTMKERAQKLGGDLEVISKASMGTKVSIHIPKLKDEQEDNN